MPRGWTIVTYAVTYSAAASRARVKYAPAVIRLYGPKKKNLGILAFYDEKRPLPRSSYSPAHGVHLTFRPWQFSQVYEILRSERPLYLGWDNRFKVGGLFSGKEPIGEFFEVMPRRE